MNTRPLRIAILSDQFSERMGYAENCLSKSLATIGHDVHVIASNAQVYSEEKFYKAVYEPFLGPAYGPCGVTRIDGFTLHRFPLKRIWRRFRYVEGLLGALDDLQPDIVQTFDCISLTTAQAAAHSIGRAYRLFTGNHTVASVYPAADGYDGLAWRARARIRLTDTMPGRLAATRVVRCYAATVDAADIATRFFGVPAPKVALAPLGVDTHKFRPASTDGEREAAREKRRALGVADDELLCIYTGRFTVDKGPVLLAQAAQAMRARGHRVRALFVGDGPTRIAIAECEDAIIRPFVPATDLPTWYRAADVGVWPRQESLSMLDAAACGLPIVISNRVRAVERVEGNGLTYEELSVDDLARALAEMEDAELRQRLGRHAVEKIQTVYSWDAIARTRSMDYADALRC